MMKSIFLDLLNLIFPPLCVSCNERLVKNEEFLCLPCITKLPKTEFHTIKDNKLERLFAGRFPFDRMASFAYFIKGGSIQSVIHELKYRNNPELGMFIGRLCGQYLKDSDFLKDVDIIVPVPLHPNRLQKRGYNQSSKIAEGLSQMVNIPVSSNNLERVIDNTSQTRNSKFERQTNTEGIFGVKYPEDFNGKRILLVDDILTTGSTIESCIDAICKRTVDVKVCVYTVGVVL